jgi:hypothetical protein
MTFWTMGMPKPSVLPVPVRAWPMMSVPASASGSVSSWMGKGWMMPAAVSASTVSWRTPRSAKVIFGSTVAGTSTCSEVVGSASAGAASVVAVVSVMVRDVAVTDSGSLLVCS